MIFKLTDQELNRLLSKIVSTKIPTQLILFSNDIKKALSGYEKEHVTYKLKNIDISMNLVENMQSEIAKNKPSILVMFTNQHQSFFERLFLSSSTADYSMKSSVPLRVFRK